MKLRKAIKEDIVFIEKLLKKNKLPYEDISSKIDCFYICSIGEKIIGIGGLEIHGDYGLLRSLVIIEHYRKRGYGKILTQKIIEYAKKKGLKEVYLLTTTAKEFFEKIGFEIVNRNAVPLEIRNSTEFKYLCPSTAVCMRLKLN
ncbi:arsenic resistance N-acetyltransferase ArsN2 [SCandidatus Aminicenantes bacterium Aminicenantia_JdfR_composite]|jgi:amino-acid N-acetyltransferase|nr:arsenic resistance N-acetyltransferase ArsN2 [SCandidatus Aminicenantes bacterium Aminicenantia_JdfR_composite]MCP2597269.1 arsenic resistance N-acetyltransferase ArsN2 [Candidatus Aminicenantes bacterium AC-335-G13]MCP2605859.1 arsenic resistance N-acetyltransferase ArsN2 [Candidatus Aminicenantes bacterium AC-335-O07]MCP2620553.1 arsenic resistance N-acetyltransferase ArsN2 [Candidatus Aminicenantes bacterium AC-334-E05]